MLGDKPLLTGPWERPSAGRGPGRGLWLGEARPGCSAFPRFGSAGRRSPSQVAPFEEGLGSPGKAVSSQRPLRQARLLTLGGPAGLHDIQHLSH